MQMTDFPALEERCFTQPLPNGLRVCVVPKPDFAGKFAFLGVNFGACDKSFRHNGKIHTVPDGTAHVLEHCMFFLPGCDPEAEFSRLGAEVNAFTDYDMTGYHVFCTGQFDACLRLLLRMAATAYFPPARVLAERSVIADEIALCDDSAEDCVQERLYRALYRTHPVRIPIAGSRRSIRAVTPETLQLCFDAFYVPSNMALVVMGDVSPEEILDIAAAAPMREAPCAVRRFAAEDPSHAWRRQTQRALPVAMPCFAAGFKADPSPDRLRQDAAGALAAELLLGESSALYCELYEKNLIDADTAAGFFRVPGAASLQVCGISRSPQAVMDALLQAPKSEFDPALFARLKRAAFGRLLRTLDGFDTTCYRICQALFSGGDCFAEFDALRSVTLAETQALLLQTVTEQRAALSVVRPL